MKFRLLVAFLLGSTSLHAQKSYFQQTVNYNIQVTLDSEDKLLRGFEKMEYINRSPDTLRYIFMHLWPNAYKNDKTAFNKQQVENGKLDFYLSEKRDRGFIDSLSFTVNGKAVAMSEYNNNPDIALITLPEPLLPGERIEIATPFRVVIPKVFSRLGFSKNNFQISQWYPKPAVYDRQGRHPMPYLDQGEFYSEFGRFVVDITVPENYVVAATGDLEQEGEKNNWISRILPKDSILAKELLSRIDSLKTDGDKEKTLRFTQDNVHDFAWFASPKYLIDTATATLANGRKVACYSFYLPKNRKLYEGSARYTAKTIEYLSKKVGEYPYNHASVVDGTLLAGGGMEYPTVTVIGSINSAATLKTVIIHEVGHNWFYGILGSNERLHPWMDEGINSYYEKKMDDAIALREVENKKGTDSNSVESNSKGLELNAVTSDLERLAYLIPAAVSYDQPCDAPADAYLPLNYGGIVYQKTAYMMDYLASYLGEATFDKLMQTYYKQWQFKHPYPEDFRKIAELVSGKNLSWFFEDALNSTEKIDFRLNHLKKIKINNSYEVGVHSRTNFRGPVPVSMCMGDSILQTQWIEYPYDRTVLFPNDPNANQIAIDPKNAIPEVNIANNAQSFNGLFRRRSIKPNLFSLGLGTNHQISFLPAIGYNAQDGFGAGLVIHNLRLPNRHFQFAFTPQYAFQSKSVVGTGIVGYSIFPKHFIRKITFAVQGSSYHHNQATQLDGTTTLFARHIAVSPSLRIDFKNKNLRNPVYNSLELRPNVTLNQTITYINQGNNQFQPQLSDYQRYSLAEAIFVHKNNRTFHPYSYQILAEGNSEFAKVGFTGNFRIDYYGEGKKARRNSFYFRAFAGKFINYNDRTNVQSFKPQLLAATYTDLNDYIYRDVFVTRNNTNTGILSQQIAMREGGFKVRTNQFLTPIGMTNDWLTTVNMRVDVPLKLPFRLQGFADFGTFANAKQQNPSGSALLFDAGVEAHFFGDLLVIYCPLAMSRDFKDYTKTVYTKNRFIQTMSFALNLGRLPILHAQEKLLDSVKF